MKAPELSTFRNFFERTVLGLLFSRSLMALLCAQMVLFGQMEALMAAPPVADAGPDLVVEKNLPLGAEVELDGNGSFDPDGDPLSFLWLGSFGSATTAAPVVAFGTGISAVSLRVDDGADVSAPDLALVEVVPCFEIAARGKGNKVQVTWPAQAGAQKFEVYRSDQTTPSNFVKIGESPAGTNLYLDLGLVSGRTYLYVVNAVMLDGRSCFSSVASAHPSRTRGALKVAPVIYSEAATTGTLDLLYTHDVNATDPNGQVLTYSLDTAPAGMAIDPASGLIQWTPPAAGNQNVTVRASDPDGLFDTQSFVVAVGELPGLNQAPVADAGRDQLALVGDTVTLDGSGSSDPDGDPLTFSWSFTLTPAGSAAALSDPTAVAPTFEVDAAGVYVVELVVNDGTVDSAPDTAVVVTLNSAPVANAGPDQSALVGETVTLDGSGSSDLDADPLTFSWSLSVPAGSSATLSDPTAVMPSFAVDVPGTYNAELIVNDGFVDSAPDTVVVTTDNSAPVADAGPNQTVLVGDTVTLDGSASNDVDGDPLTFTWTLTSTPAGSSAALSDPSAVTPSFAADVAGSYQAQLIVNDGTVDSTPDTVTITTGNTPPVAEAGPAQTVLVGDTVTLDGSGSSDVDGDALTFFWSLSSVPAGSAAAVSDPSAVAPTFVADQPGSYVAQLIVNDGTIDSAPDTVTITTGNSPPVADAGPGQSVLVGDTVTLDGSGSGDVDGDPLTFSWTLTSVPAGSAAALSDSGAVTPTFVADVAGSYVAQLVVNDGTADSAPDSVTITTGNSPPVAGAGPDQTVLVGDTVTLDGGSSIDVDGDALTFSWSLTSVPAGSAAAALSDPSAVMPTFLADAPGSYVAQLIVNDGTVNSAPDTVTITTGNSLPVADAGPDQTVLVNDLVSLDGSGSSDVDGDALTFSWSLTSKPAGSAAALSAPGAVLPSFVADLPGSYVAQLIVNDGIVDSAPDTVTIVTGNSPPVADAGPDQTVLVGDTVTLDGSGSSDVDGDALTFFWSLTSAPLGSTAALSDPFAVGPDFVADLAGTYVVQLIINDGTVDSAPDCVMITTGNSRPVAEAGPSLEVELDSVVTLDGSASSDADGDPLTFSWSFTSRPTGSSAALSDPSAVSPTFVPDVEGFYTLQLIVSDGVLDSAPDTVTFFGFIPTVEVPDVVGLPQAAAEAAIVDAELAVGTVGADFSDTVPSGSIISQNPAGGAEVPEGSAVDLVVSLGPEPATVPDVVGLPQAAAEAAIVGAGLAVGTVSTANSPTVPAGNVISQNPTGGTSVVAGSAVDLVISLGPPLVVVPDVVGLPQAAAEAAIVGEGLTVGTVSTANSPTVPAGNVISQNPTGGASVAPASTVNLVVSLGPSPLSVVPDLAGLTELQAEVALFNATLALGSIGLANSDTVPVNTIISQAPLAGTTVDPGTAVNVVLSVGPAVSDTTPPVVSIASPATNTEVTYLTDVIGSVADANLAFYKVEIARSDLVDPNNIAADDPDYRLIAEGSSQKANELLGTFDPTTLQNDSYVLRLKATDSAGLSSAVAITVSVCANAKLGQFSLAFVDLSIPLVGIPVQVIRRYSTLDANDRGDFGFGWSLSFYDADIRTTTPDQGGSFFNQTAFRDEVTRVYLTTPEGKRVGFTFYLQQTGGGFLGFTYTPRFRPDPGVYETLATTGADNALGRAGDGSAVLFFGGFAWRPDNYVLTTKDGTSYRYTVAGVLQDATDLNGNSVTFAPTGITHSTGVSIDFIRDAQGRITEITDPAGNPIQYAYDTTGDLVSVTDQENLQTQFTYRPVPRHYLDEVIDPLGRMAQKTVYGPDGRIEKVIDALGNEILQDFDPNNFLGTITDARGNITRLTYNNRGNIIREERPEGGVILYRYDDPPNPDRETSVTDPNGGNTLLTYDVNGNFASRTDPLGNVKEYTYNPLGKITSLVRKNDTGTVLSSEAATYDAAGNLTSITNCSGNTRTFTYDAQGRIASLTDFAGNVTQYQYPPGGGRAPSLITYPDGSTKQYTYDANGRPTSQTGETGAVTRLEYDGLGRRVREIDAEGNATESVYDGSGNVIRRTDRLGRIRSFAYDSNNRLIEEARILTDDGDNSDDVFSRFEYDASDNLTALVDPAGNRTEFVYDGDGRLVTRRDPAGAETGISYDGNGNVMELIDRNNRKRSYLYDARNLVTSERWHDAGDAIIRTIATEYDGLGRRLRVSDPDSDYSYIYDACSRVATVSNLGTPNVPEVILSYTYTPDGRVASITDNDGVSVTTSYDTRGWSDTLVWQGGGINPVSVALDRNARGQVNHVMRHNNAGLSDLVSQTTYDDIAPQGWIKQVNHRDGTGTLYNPGSAFSYSYDAEGQVITQSSQGNTTTYTYDLLGQLTGADHTAAAYPDESYTYDGAGNRTSSHLHPSYTTGTANRVTADGVHSYTYDNEGNLTVKTVVATGNTETLTYDHRGRLTMAVTRDAAGTTTNSQLFTYDVFNRRIGRNLNGESEFSVFHAHDAWADFDDTGAVLKRYLVGGLLDSKFATFTPGESTQWFLTDTLGSIRGVTDGAGQLDRERAYDSFGRTVQDSGGLGRFGFTGREADSDSLTYFRARYFNPELGKFISEDPLRFQSRDFNLYRYVSNSPTNLTDPTGMIALAGYALLLPGRGAKVEVEAGPVEVEAGIEVPSYQDVLLAGIGYMHGFGATNLIFVGEVLGDGLDGAVERTALHVSALTLPFSQADGPVGAFFNGVNVSIGWEIELEFALELECQGSYDLFEDSFGGFNNGAKFALARLRAMFGQSGDLIEIPQLPTCELDD